MPSDDKKKRDAKKKAAQLRAVAKSKTTSSTKSPDDVGDEPDAGEKSSGEDEEQQASGTGKAGASDDSFVDEFAKIDLVRSEASTVTGVLLSHKQSRDIHIGSITLSCFGQVLLEDGLLELNNGRRYGLIGQNGCGKSTLLSCISNRELPIPEHFDIYYLSREMAPSEKTALECVIDVDKERAMLEREATELASCTDEASQDRLMDVYERLEFLDADKAAARAAAILAGLGFKTSMQSKQAKDFSGGWRMRIALARALYVRPRILLLDEPTNHLDLTACCWLEEELKNYKRILVIVSHSQDFLNGVCTNIIHMQNNKLRYYGGNYDQYASTRSELETNQMKKFKSEQNKIKEIKDFVARFGHGTEKLARQAQSREKMLNRMVESGLTESVAKEEIVSFHFPDCAAIPPPVIMVQNVSFRYSRDSPIIFQGLEFGFDLDSRVALVGPNGAGKSTLLKLIDGELTPTGGVIRRHSHVKCCRYNQHLTELLDLDKSALDWMMEQFPEMKEDDHRKLLGRFGLSGSPQTCIMRLLSDGQRCRVVFAWLAQQAPHILLLDEPTNHLDIETIDALADSINDYEGGVILVSHDFRLISQVAEEIWLCDKGSVNKWPGDIYAYKKKLMARVRRLIERHKVAFA